MNCTRLLLNMTTNSCHILLNFISYCSMLIVIYIRHKNSQNINYFSLHRNGWFFFFLCLSYCMCLAPPFQY